MFLDIFYADCGFINFYRFYFYLFLQLCVHMSSCVLYIRGSKQLIRMDQSLKLL